MEENKDNPTRRGKGESETKYVSSETNDEVQLEERTADSKLSGKNDKSIEGEDETISASAARSHRVMAELTLGLTGDPTCIEIGSENFLLHHAKRTNVKQFSNKLYDLCGRQICVINMLGLPNVDKIQLNQAVQAFILLIPNGQHSSHYRSGIEWLERTFGKECLSFVMTVLTHKSDGTCERALTDLKAIHSFVEQRYHTCTRSMMDLDEIMGLLKKVDAMVSENNPQYDKRKMFALNEELKMQHHHFLQTERMKTVEMKTGSKIKLKCDPPKKHGDAEHLRKSEDGTAKQPETKPGHCEPKKKTGTCEMDLSGNKKSAILTEEQNKENLPRETEILFDILHLQDSYPQKMSPADFLKIDPPVKQSNETCEKDLAQAFIQRLMMLDYRARYIFARQDSSEVSHPEVLPESDSTDTDDEDLYGATSEEQAHVHPMDVQMAVFHCSDSFLKQNMITKLSQCQYALPLFVPDPVSMDIECPLWTFRKITKTWKKTDKKQNSVTVIMKSMPVCKAETPLVSFFRLGSLSLSKSQLMNTLINDRHSTFFHRNCPGSTKSPHLMDGVAEITWYCPAGKPNDSFTDCVAFCNLHGDSLLIEKQCEINFQ